MATEATRFFAGDCTVCYEGDERREDRGSVVVLVKPDGTVLVHDRAGYRPVAWLTRAESVSFSANNGIALRAERGDHHLEVTCHDEVGSGRYPVSRAGTHVARCPDCDGALIHAAGTITCLGCDASYSVPSDATLTDATCDKCGLPRMSVDRGATFDLCIDRRCDPLDEAVRERFDRAWTCPGCGGDLLILRRGGLIAGCEHYPECETGYSLPAGTVDGTCGCGLPTFETSSGQRCLDAACSIG